MVQGVSNTVEQVKDGVAEVASRFKSGTITHTFKSSLPEITSTAGNVLEVAVVRTQETFQKEDSLKYMGVYFGTTTAEIRVPATFRYHLNLSDHWQLATRSNVCLVLAPPIRPSLPVAINTELMEKRAESGWARFNKTEILDGLEKGITKTLEERATDSLHLESVRESCRKSVAEFVKNWLLKEDQWRTDRFSSIIVLFPDEVPPGTNQPLLHTDRVPVLNLSTNF